LKPSPGKGWGAIATRGIARGAQILKEKPLFVVRKPHEKITEWDVRAALQQLAPSKKQQFTHLRDNASKPFTQLTHAFAENSFAIPSSIRNQDNAPHFRVYSSYNLISTIRVYQTPRFRIPLETSLQVLQPGISSPARRSLSAIIQILNTGLDMTATKNYVLYAIAKPV
jgi:hypothetical protein